MITDDFSKSTVTIKKDELLNVIRMNRLKHLSEYSEAYNAYRLATIDKLQEMLTQAKEGGKIESSTQLEAPFSRIKEYDIVIKMLEMSVKDEITITQNQFNQFVLDEWNWSEMFKNTISIYNNRKNELYQM